MWGGNGDGEDTDYMDVTIGAHTWRDSADHEQEIQDGAEAYKAITHVFKATATEMVLSFRSGANDCIDIDDVFVRKGIDCTVPFVDTDAPQECSWKCAAGWIKYGTGDEWVGSNYKCYLPRAPTLTLIPDTSCDTHGSGDCNGGKAWVQAVCDQDATWTDTAGATCIRNEIHCTITAGEDCSIAPTVTTSVVDMTILGT